MSIPPLEAVADAIMLYEGWYAHPVPSMSYRQRNPGNLESNGQKRVFPSLKAGYDALLDELIAKFSGANSHGIGPDSTLQQLFNIYAPTADNNQPNAYCQFVAGWVSKVLEREITPATQLKRIWAG